METRSLHFIILFLLISFANFPALARRNVKFFRHNVGVKQKDPQSALHIRGHLMMTDGSQALDRVMVSDINGQAHWVPFNSLTFNGVSLDTNGFVMNNGTIINSDFDGGNVNNAVLVNTSLDSLVVENATVLNDFIYQGQPWKLAHFEDYENAVSGWNNSTRTSCGVGNQILGGAGVSSTTPLTKIFNLAGIRHTHVFVRYNYYYLNSWDANEHGELHVDGIRRWLSSNILHTRAKAEHFPNCGAPAYSATDIRDRDSMMSAHAAFNHTGDLLTLDFRSTLNEAANLEAFGIDNLEIWVMDSTRGDAPRLVSSNPPLGMCSGRNEGDLVIGNGGLTITTGNPYDTSWTDRNGADPYEYYDWTPYTAGYQNDTATATALCHAVAGTPYVNAEITSNGSYATPGSHNVAHYTNADNLWGIYNATNFNDRITELNCRCGSADITTPSSQFYCNDLGFHPIGYWQADRANYPALGGHGVIADFRKCRNLRYLDGGHSIDDRRWYFPPLPRSGDVTLTISRDRSGQSSGSGVDQDFRYSGNISFTNYAMRWREGGTRLPSSSNIIRCHYDQPTNHYTCSLDRSVSWQDFTDLEE